MIRDELFRSADILLTEIEAEPDAFIEAEWTMDPVYAATFQMVPFKPMTASELQDKYEKKQKESSEQGRPYAFAIRRRSDDSLIGFLRFPGIEWSNREARMQMSFGQPQWEEQYGEEVLRIALRYAFGEMNLHRLGFYVPEFLAGRAALLEKLGFQQEVRRRRLLYYKGRLWDQFLYGMLEDEWQTGSDFSEGEPQ